MITFYLIDTENIPVKWVNDINPNNGDVIFLFRLKDSQKNYISLDDAVKIANLNAKMYIIECERGKPKMNALDFQLISYLGYLVARNEDALYIVYSNDTGFDPAIEYWKNRSIDVKRIGTDENEK